MTPVDLIHPYVWWLKIRDEPTAPDGFELRGDSLFGVWRGGRLLLSESDMRAFGYEKCFCDPHTATVEVGCIAHLAAGMDSTTEYPETSAG